jgi:PAS domain S-box-containing protein
MHESFANPPSDQRNSRPRICMKVPLNVLLVEDNENDALLLEAELERGGYEPRLKRVCTADQLKTCLHERSWDIVLSDYTMPVFNGLEALTVVKESGLDVPFIIVSGTMGEERAVMAMKAGASDFLVKGDLARLIPAVEREVREAKERDQRRAAEEALAAAQANFQTLVENSIVGIYVIQEGRFVYVNPIVTDILGYSAEELTSRPVLEFISPEDRSLARDNVQKRMEGLIKSIRYTLRMQRKNGGIAEVEVHGTRTDYKGVPSILGILLDISQRRQAEERFSRLFRASPVGITLTSMKEDVIIETNEAFLSMVGYESDALIGQRHTNLNLWNSDDKARIEDSLRRDGKVQNFEANLRRKDGETIQVLVSIEMLDVGGERNALAFFHDITEKRKMEAQFLRNQRMESIGTLAGGIAHDLNNALAPILMTAQMLRLRFQDSEVQEMLDILESSAQRGADMVKQVLTFARGLEGRHGTVQLKHLIRDMAAIGKHTFPKSIQIKEQIAKDLWTISGDATQLHQVALNLCVNARDAMPDGGILTLTATNVELDENSARLHREAKPGPYVELGIVDTGTGMPTHVQEHIFEPFFTTKGIGKGTGLGLSTVSSIVKHHHGFLVVETAEGKGTHFKIYLPAIATSAASAGAPQRPVLPSGNGEWVLVVDDEALIRDIARQMLQTFGYHVLVATNGAEAVAACAKHGGKIQVMITDLAMPVMDGSAAIEAVRAIDPNLKVIVASGSAFDSKKYHWDDRPTVRAIIEKPYTPEKLLTTLHKTLSASNRPAIIPITEAASEN